ncbi:MAG: hypothetical protein WBE76_21095 [Terracidiphilus sp.]
MDIAWLTPDSLELLDNQPVVGRMFGLNDQGRMVGIVDEEAAAEIFGSQTAGVVILDTADRPIEIIGVVKRKSNDAKQQRHPTIYYDYLEHPVAPSPIRDAKLASPLHPL